MALTRIEHDRKISTFTSGKKVEIERREISSILDISVGSDVQSVAAYEVQNGDD